MAKKKSRDGEYASRRRERLINKLAAIEDYHATVPADLRRMLENRATPQDIMEYAARLAAARLVTELGSTDPKQAMEASKQILDRTQGKAVERVQQHHKFEKLDEEQLDALILSQLKEVGSLDGDEDGENGQS